MPTVFEKIINRELPADILLENDHVIAIRDIQPRAPIHILFIIKKVIPRLQHMKEEELFYMGELVKAVQELAKKMEIENYRFVINNGEKAGQTVFHLHAHLLAGADMPEGTV